jgi:hypothetical protein
MVLVRLVATHDSAPTCRQLPWGRLKTPRAQRRDRSTWEEYQGGHSMRILGSFLVAAAIMSINLDKILH